MQCSYWYLHNLLCINQLHRASHHCKYWNAVQLQSILQYILYQARYIYIETHHSKYRNPVQLLSKSQYNVYQARYTQQHITVTIFMQYNYCQFLIILCIKPVIHTNTSLWLLVCSTITVNIILHCVSTQINTSTHHWKYCSAVKLFSITHYIVYKVCYAQQHITVNIGLW
jgi:hypothetical protein